MKNHSIFDLASESPRSSLSPAGVSTERGVSFAPLAGVILYRLFLDYIYQASVFPLNAYMGFYNVSDTSLYICSWGVLLVSLPFFLFCSARKNIGNVILTIIYLLNFVPATSCMHFMPPSATYLVQFCTYWFLLFVFAVIIPHFNRIWNFSSATIVYAASFIFLLTILGVSWKYTGFHIILDLDSVYAFRLEAREYSMSVIERYLISAARCCLPLLMVYAIARKSKLYAGIIGFTLLLLFSFDGSKTVIFTTVLALLCYYFFTWQKKRYIVWGFAGLSFLAAAEQILRDYSYISDYVIRRIMFLPHLLASFYFDFFSKNEVLFYRDGFLGNIFPSPYNIPSPHLIGKIYLGAPDCAANVGVFAESYANLGTLGCLISPLLVILLLRSFEYCSSGLDFRLLIVPAISIAIGLCESYLSVLLLTHGFLSLCIICLLLPREMKDA